MLVALAHVAASSSSSGFLQQEVNWKSEGTEIVLRSTRRLGCRTAGPQPSVTEGIRRDGRTATRGRNRARIRSPRALTAGIFRPLMIDKLIVSPGPHRDSDVLRKVQSRRNLHHFGRPARRIGPSCRRQASTLEIEIRTDKWT
jgi:hypothetical protein